MKIEGTLEKIGRLWEVHMPMLHAYTQGRSRKEALMMAGDWVESMLDIDGFKATATPTSKLTFELSANNPEALMSLILRRQRSAKGLSFKQAANRMGQKSPNAYARYETGACVPSLAKFTTLLAAVGAHMVLRPGA